MEMIFITALVFLVYTWAGYIMILYCLTKIIRSNSPYFDISFQPFVSILVSAYNEADVIEERIKNFLSLNYPKDRLEILVGSDGSTDETVKIVNKYSDVGIKGIAFPKNRGRADVHNDLVKMAKGSILVFTDADTIFDRAFVQHIVKPFSNSKNGVAVGRLTYMIKGGDIATNEGLYWKYELKIKEFENALGIINKGTGACMAIRKELFKPLAAVDDIDAAAVIDILLDGYKCVYIPDALAYDIPPHSVISEFRMRIRGSAKYLSSFTWRRMVSLLLKRPVICWSILSHTVFRRFSPYFMASLFLLNLFLLERGLFYQIAFLIQIIFYLLAILGWIANKQKIYIPVASNAFSFCVAMLGMMVGVAKAFTGSVTVTYKTDDIV